MMTTRLITLVTCGFAVNCPRAKQAGFAELLEINLQTARAWSYKEQFVGFWTQPDAAQGLDFFT